jgi:hypothetical protein
MPLTSRNLSCFIALATKPEFAIWTYSSYIVWFSSPGQNEFGARAGRREISRVPTARCCASDEPRLLPRNRFLRHYSDPLPSTPDFVSAIGVLPARRRQRPDPPQHLAKQPPVQMPLGWSANFMLSRDTRADYNLTANMTNGTKVLGSPGRMLIRTPKV